ncbi:serine/threonine-protein kinase [Brachybacterium saurashtrense]|uniref:Serine/threonine protein kinase n=1 Tax=Brachybacterium saurashtrense TaxID=556288 RepID=A0A345YK99_9MICO|nr:serine/threonine-protein kinase [Brachybacterium saurashtrense]AXK44351.1 serine/threonine protein kinase [Brachybacterium saurashtrense]RRR21293.1 serine/threonine protein kinase [Brachybacterium saurashtrense]RRR22962.1 serine/threonine protein kinase [Brachybacterium saurashtrense]
MATPRTPRRAAQDPLLRDPRLRALAEDSGYEVLGRIGAGGMGIVYRARDADGNDVAIKLLRHEIADDARARERLAREVAAQKLVRNDSIVRILDAELDSADAFVVTEFVPGPTLEDAVRAHDGLHPEAVREIGLALGETLRQIHAAGVIHRDLKPSNVLLRGASEGDLIGFDPDGDRLDPVIIDFGIAIAAEESRLTSTGLVMGTAAYLDPAVIRTDRAGEAGDWWAWAALLAFAATGREPYGTGRADLVFLRAERGEIDVEGVPTELDAWLRAALTAEPAQRPAPEVLLERLAALDLDGYDDPGATELLDAAGRTAVLPLAGAAAAEPEQGASADEPAPGGDARRAEEHPTRALPVVTSPAQAPDADAQRTEALPAMNTPSEPPTEALPRHTERPEPATEALPVTGPPTRALPVVPPQAGPAGTAPVPGQPAYGQPPYAPGRSAPQPVAAPAPYGRPHPAPQTMPQQALPPQTMPQQAGTPPFAPPQFAPQHPSALPPGAPGAWPVPPPRRPLLVWMGHLLLVALAGVAPYVSLALLLVLGAMARTWERSHRTLSTQRMRGAHGAGPAWRAGLAAPFRGVLGLLEIALQALLPLILGLLVGIAVDAAWTLLQGNPPPDGLAFVLAMSITVLLTWVGLGSATTRNGAHRMLDAAAPDRLWGAVMLVLLLILLGAVVVTLLAREGMVDYFPFPDGPRLDQIALWRL